MKRYFSAQDKHCVKDVFQHAESLVNGFYRSDGLGIQDYRYDVKTLADLCDHEVNEKAFAQLCRYVYTKKTADDKKDDYFFAICLQDNRILDAVNRGGSFVRLPSLLLYIATHELVHVARFGSGEVDFDAAMEERLREEEKVDIVTRQILYSVADVHLKVVLDCFDERYHIGDIFTQETRIIN